MTGVTVPADRRPSLGKYILFGAVGIAFLDTFVLAVAGSGGDPALLYGGILAAVLGNTAVLLVLVQWLLEEWFEAAVVVDE